jgi:hypothetical protein
MTMDWTSFAMGFLANFAVLGFAAPANHQSGVQIYHHNQVKRALMSTDMVIFVIHT